MAEHKIRRNKGKIIRKALKIRRTKASEVRKTSEDDKIKEETNTILHSYNLALWPR